MVEGAGGNGVFFWLIPGSDGDLDPWRCRPLLTDAVGSFLTGENVDTAQRERRRIRIHELYFHQWPPQPDRPSPPLLVLVL